MGLLNDHGTVERRGLAYHVVIAGRLDAGVVARARETLGRWDARGGFDPAITRRWRALLDRPVEEIRAAILADTEVGRELRHTSPLGDAITQAERDHIIATVC